MPALVAMIFLSTSGLAGVVLHLCEMEGLVRSHCCCHKSEDHAPPVQLKRVDECCGSVLPAGEHPPVSTGAADFHIDAPLMVASAAFALEPFAAPVEDATYGWARGPPSHGPPLFVWHCSYLN